MTRPIVLHHGLFGFDKIEIKNFRLEYWGNVPNLLNKLGYKVYISKVGMVHSIKQRSDELHDFMTRNNIRDAHLICHSLGGLDARYLLDTYRSRPDKVNIKSMTTLGTPHLGSEFMDLLNDKLGLGYRYTTLKSPKPKSLLYSLLYYLDQPAYSCLTTSYCEHFNKTVELNTDAHYYSIGAKFQCSNESMSRLAQKIVDNDLNSLPILQILKIKKLDDYINLLERVMFLLSGDNDGIVSIKSSHFQNYLTTLHGSHWDLVDKSGRFGLNMDPKVEEMYCVVVNKLKELDT
eukprot:NODE_442_length_8548_cov_0.231862.p4 type:complete len:290 gc:universal NODE_442_length_8548_cov_0.231862:6795-5926(-)